MRLIGLLLCLIFQPERIDPPDPDNPDYDVRADVWSLGLSLVSYSSNLLRINQMWIDVD